MLVFLILLLVLFILLVLFLVFLVFLILIFLVLLFLLLLLLLEVFKELFGDVAVLGGEFVIGVQSEGFVVMFESVFPISLLGIVFLGGLTFSHKGIGKVVGCVFAELLVLGEEGICEVRDGFFKVAGFVGGRSRVELESLG